MMLTVEQLRDMFAEHYDKLYTFKAASRFLIFACGIIIEIQNSTILVYCLPENKTNELISELMTELTLNAASKIIDSRSKSFKFDINDPNSIEAIDSLVTSVIKELVDKGKEKWAFR